MSFQPSRREFLVSMLGSSAVLAGCGLNSGSRELPPGQLVGASADVGHRLRGKQLPQVSEDHWSDVDVVIVGGGVAGLSAARRLQRNQCDNFVLLELESVPGGTARGGTTAVVPCPWGAHYLPAPQRENRDLVQLLDEFDLLDGVDEFGDPLVKEQYLCRGPQERLFIADGWFEGLYPWHTGDTEHARQFAAFRREIDRWAQWKDGRGCRAFTLPMEACSDDDEVTSLDRISMAEWMDRLKFTSPRLRWYVDFACRDDYGLRLEQTSAWAGVFYFAARLPEPGRPTRPFITFPEGNGRLVSKLAEPLKHRLQTGWAVADIAHATSEPNLENSRLRTAPRIEVTCVRSDGQLARGYRARQVILATPRFLDRYLIRSWRRDPPAHLQKFTYSAWAVANLTLKDRPTEDDLPLAWDNVLYDSPALGYVVATHQALIDYGPTVFTWYYPVCDDDGLTGRARMLDGGREDWAEVCLEDLSRAHSQIRELTTQIDIARWGHAMVRPTPGLIHGGARAAAMQSWRGVHFANADLSGLPLFEEAFDRGNRAADAALVELSKLKNS